MENSREQQQAGTEKWDEPPGMGLGMATGQEQSDTLPKLNQEECLMKKNCLK